MPTFQPLQRLIGAVSSMVIAIVISTSAFAGNVTLQTEFGVVEIELFDDATPMTVANFLKYVNDGDYTDSFIHRSAEDFVVQGGGFYYADSGVEEIPTDPPVINEPGISNVRGTIAMAKLGGDPNSATSQWFINLKDNSEVLDNANGGYTVFGRVIGNGMDVVDQIAALRTWNFGIPFNELPLIDYSGSGPIPPDSFVMSEIEVEVESSFLINPGLTDTWYFEGTNGQGFFIIVYPEIESIFLSWFTFDTQRPDDTVTANLGDPGHRWITAQGSYEGNSAVLDVYITSGGIFDSGTPVPISEKDGTITVEFTGCNSGSVTYDIPSISAQDVVPIERVFADASNMARCEELASAASLPVNVEVNEPTASENAQQ